VRSHQDPQPGGPDPAAGAPLAAHESQRLRRHQDVGDGSRPPLPPGVLLRLQRELAPVAPREPVRVRTVQAAVGAAALPASALAPPGGGGEHLRERRPRQRGPVRRHPRQRKVMRASVHFRTEGERASRARAPLPASGSSVILIVF
jgi:hypothetical protein